MFGIGSTELIVIALVLLIFVGPRHLPGMARKIGQILGELRMASRELRNQIDFEMPDIESPSKMVRDVGRELIDSVPSPYEEVRKVERKLKQELAETAYEESGEGSDPETDDGVPGIPHEPEVSQETVSSKEQPPSKGAAGAGETDGVDPLQSADPDKDTDRPKGDQ